MVVSKIPMDVNSSLYTAFNQSQRRKSDICIGENDNDPVLVSRFIDSLIEKKTDDKPMSEPFLPLI